jgi:Ca2+-binding RTX toxin-like protein
MRLTPSGVTVGGNFFIDSSVPGAVTRGTGLDATATSLTYTLANGRTVIVTGTGFTYDAGGIPLTGLITGVQLFDGPFELATFYDVPNRTLADFDRLWLGTAPDENDPNAVFNHLLPGNDTLIGSDGDDSFALGKGSDIVDGGNGIDEVVYRGFGRGEGITVDLHFGDGDDHVGAAWAGGTSTPLDAEFDTLFSIENVFGSRFNVLLIGDNHNNVFTASRGDDTIHGGGTTLTPDTDELRYDRGATSTAGITVTFTDEGIGSVTGGGLTPETDDDPANTVFGIDTFTGIETVRGTRFADTFIGDDGTQRFRGLGGIDSYNGGDGDDEVDYSRDNLTTAGITVNLAGADDSDDIGSAIAAGGETETLISIEQIRGTAGEDSMTGDDADNRFRGEGGNDTLLGGAGNDRLQGGAGNDTMDGGSDEDEVDYLQDTLVVGGNGVTLNLTTGVGNGPNGDTDTIIDVENARGTINDDLITGDSGANRLRGDDGNDTLWGAGDNDELEGGLGDDELYGEDGDDTLTGNAGTDRYFGGDGADTFVGGGGSDGDIADYSQDIAGHGIVANLWGSGSQGGLAADTVLDAFDFLDSVSNVPNLVGTQFSDRIYGGSHNNILSGGAGDDFIFGHDGADTLDGGYGNDVLDGGAGLDAFSGGYGNDTYYVNATGEVVTEATGLGSGSDTVITSVTYALTANAAVETLRAVTPGSTLAMNLTGSSAGNAITGNNGINILTGLAGDDTLMGLGGNDTIVGGLGRDTMIGGAGKDIFDFNLFTETAVGANRDVVHFSRSDLDKIDLKQIDANVAAGGDQAFSWKGTGLITGAGQLRYDVASGVVQGNIGGANGIGIDFEIKVVGVTSMLATDFIL